MRDVSPFNVCVSWPQSENDLLGSSYANALVDLASDKNNLEEVHADMDALGSILKVRHAVRSAVGTCFSPRCAPTKLLRHFECCGATGTLACEDHWPKDRDTVLMTRRHRHQLAGHQ